MTSKPAVSVRTLLISDLHLGCRHAQVEACLKFLRSYRPDQIYLVGDIIDGWKANRDWHWSSQCDEILTYFEQLIAEGTSIFYLPGNHDAFLRHKSASKLLPQALSNVQIADEFVFESLSGWRFLVTHGDLFDTVEQQAQWLSKAFAGLYDAILSGNRWISRRLFGTGRNPYAACALLKGRVKRAIKFISHFEDSIVAHARQRNCEGVICGHIHTPDLVHRADRLYCNTGDWVENCTGLVEHHDGRFCLESAYQSSRALLLPDHPRRELSEIASTSPDQFEPNDCGGKSSAATGECSHRALVG